MPARGSPSKSHRRLRPRRLKRPRNEAGDHEKPRLRRCVEALLSTALEVSMSSNRLLLTAMIVCAALGWRGTATAEMSRAVMTAFKGDLVITKGELPEGKTEKETIAKIKSERLKELTGEARDDVTYWHFHYTAFLSKS